MILLVPAGAAILLTYAATVDTGIESVGRVNGTDPTRTSQRPTGFAQRTPRHERTTPRGHRNKKVPAVRRRQIESIARRLATTTAKRRRVTRPRATAAAPRSAATTFPAAAPGRAHTVRTPNWAIRTAPAAGTNQAVRSSGVVKKSSTSSRSITVRRLAAVRSRGPAIAERARRAVPRSKKRAGPTLRQITLAKDRKTAAGRAKVPLTKSPAPATVRKSGGRRRSKRLIAAQAPPGFENLMKPQTTLVDVIFGDKILGQALATFSPGRLRFHDPEKVAKLIPGLKEAPSVAQALTGELKSNPHLLCSTFRPKNCGILSPKVAGIIFDEGRFKVQVFVNPALLTARPAFSEKFLPTPKNGPSFIQILSGAVAGTSNTEPDYNFRGRSILGYENARLRADLSYSSTDNFIADQVFGELDKPGLQYRGGLFRSEGTSLLGERKIFGASVSTSTDLRMDVDQAYGSQLVVFLTRRATVEILREGRLLSSRTYESGNQTLDTSRLPNGAYTVTLRIREAGGRVREEQRFFVKSTNIPPWDQPLYLAQIGVLADDRNRAFPDATAKLFYRFGMAHRVANWLALGADILGTDDQAVLEPGGILFTKHVSFRLAGLVSTDADYGVSAIAYGTIDNLSYSLNFRRIWSSDSGPIVPDQDPSNFDPITGSFTQVNGAVNYTVGNARIGFVGSWRKGDAEPESYFFGPTLYWPLWRHKNFTVTLTAEVTRSNIATTGIARLRFRYSQPKVTVLAEAGARHTIPRSGQTLNVDKTRAIGRLSATYVEKNVLDHEVTLQAQIDRDDTTVAGAEALVRGPRGRFRAMAEQVLEGARKETRYNGGFVIGGAVNAKGVAVGGRETYNSAVIIRLRGLAKDAVFRVLVDGAPKGQAHTSHDLVLFLPPYEIYKIRLQSVSGPLASFDANDRKLTLLPGTVQTLTWQVNPIVAVFGQALRTGGLPVANASIKGVIGIGATDDLGFFQVEVGNNLTLVLEEGGRSPCRISLGNLRPKNGVASVGKITCR
ncbi:MAG: TcfC E-set like domain-containing protein [Pseudomonadota bacterium]